MGIVCNVPKLSAALGSHEPPIRTVGALLVGHRAGFEMAVGTTVWSSSQL
jgi:hypothetical protein